MNPFYCHFVFYFLLSKLWAITSAQVALPADQREFLTGLRCAGQRDEEGECPTGLCYDSININNDFVQTGCATEDMCTVSGCALNSSTEQFVCCCTHPFCNGKSHRMVKARWRMFQNGDYKQPAPRKPAVRSANPRLQPRNVAVQVVAKDNATTSTTTSFTPTPAPKAFTTKSATQKQKEPSVPRAHLQDTTTERDSPKTAPSKPHLTTTTPKYVIKSATASTRKVVVNNPTTKATKKQDVSNTTARPIKRLEAKTTSMKPIKKDAHDIKQITTSTLSSKSTPKAVITTMPTSGTTNTASVSTTSNSPSTENNSPPPAAKAADQTTTRKLEAELQFTAAVTSAPKTNAQTTAPKLEVPLAASIRSVAESLSKDSRTMELPSTTTESSSASSITAPPPSNTTASSNSKNRSTRAPVKQPNVVYQLPVSYPWYWICLLGFTVAALTFLAVFACLRRCGKCRRQGVGRPERLQEEQDNNHNSGHANGPTNPIIKNGKRKVKRKADNSLIKSKHLVNGITDESLVSRCTTVTTASSNACSDTVFGEEDGLGRELTVIDPLLNKSISGTLQGENTTKH